MASRILAFFSLATALARSQAETCADGSLPLSWDGTVSDGSQDVETALNFAKSSGDSLTLGYVEDRRAQVVYLRFQNIEVPPSAEILGAKVIFTVKQAGARHGQDFNVVVSALRRSKFFPEEESFRSFALLMADGTTAANVSFAPDTNPAETESESADLSSIVHEYVRYPGYKNGNAITFLFGNGPTSQTTQSRQYYSFESGGAEKGPRLSITYCLSGSAGGAGVGSAGDGVGSAGAGVGSAGAGVGSTGAGVGSAGASSQSDGTGAGVGSAGAGVGSTGAGVGSAGASSQSDGTSSRSDGAGVRSDAAANAEAPKVRCEGSMCDDMGSVKELEKAKVLGVFGASEQHNGMQLEQWHIMPSLGFVFVSLAAVGMTVKLASRRYCSRQSHSCTEWDDGVKEACIE